MNENNLNMLDKFLSTAAKQMENPKSSFVFGGLFFLGFFYAFIHLPSIENYKKMLQKSEEHASYWKKEHDDCKDECEVELKLAEEKIEKAKAESFDNLIKTNSFLQELKSDKADKATLTKKIADYQNETLN
jgi:hypothetical protein